MPTDHSNYNRTFNVAIDLVAQAVGWAQKYSCKPLAAVRLKPTAFMSFVKGVEVMRNQEVTPEEQENLTFEGVKVLKGGRGQIDTMVLEYVENVHNILAAHGRN
jgi:hypothetical protein